MDTYYTQSDFSEYTHLFPQPYGLAQFVDALNVIERNQEPVCAFYRVMKQIKQRSVCAFDILDKRVDANALAVYLYCKFLLLESREACLGMLNDMHHRLECDMNPDHRPDVLLHIQAMAATPMDMAALKQRETKDECSTYDNDADAFVCRIEKNIDKYVAMWNYFYVMHGRTAHIEYDLAANHILNIPTDQVLFRFEKRHMEHWMRVSCVKELIRDAVYSPIFETMEHAMQHQSKTTLMYERFLRARFGYDRDKDTHNVFMYLEYNTSHSKVLRDIFCAYKQSSLYEALKTVHDVRQRIETDKHGELAAYLDHVLNVHDFF